MLRNLVGVIASVAILPNAAATEFKVTITDEQVRMVRDFAEHPVTKNYASDAMIREGLEVVCRQLHSGQTIYEIALGQYEITKKYTGTEQEAFVDFFSSLNCIAVFETCPNYVKD